MGHSNHLEIVGLATATQAKYEQFLVHEPVLILLSAGYFNFGVDQNNVVLLPSHGNVYTTFHVSDDGGCLTLKPQRDFRQHNLGFIVLCGQQRRWYATASCAGGLAGIHIGWLNCVPPVTISCFESFVTTSESLLGDMFGVNYSFRSCCLIQNCYPIYQR